MQDELLAALDSSGKILPEPVSRQEAHRRGIWHRSVAIFVLSSQGEILLEKRSLHKDLFPGFFDIPGGHVRSGQAPAETAREELREELGLVVEPSRLQPLSEEDAILERVVLPEKAIINLERKTAYLVEINETEEQSILQRAAEWARASAHELAMRGPEGEVSHIELWSWERLQHALRDRDRRRLASGVESALSDEGTRNQIGKRILDLRDERRREFWEENEEFLDCGNPVQRSDRRLFELLVDSPTSIATTNEVDAIFELGTDEISGAYLIGNFRLQVAGDAYWGAKLLDPATRYVDNLLQTVAFGCSTEAREKLLDAAPAARRFVAGVLNFPLENGSRFRDGLGNLTEIAVARKAVLIWLRKYAAGFLSAEVLDNPTRSVAHECLKAGRTLLTTWSARSFTSDKERLKDLALLGLGASAVDFNNPQFQVRLAENAGPGSWILQFIEERTAESLCPELGADAFLDEFCDRYLASGQPVELAFLPGSAAQAYVSLALCQEMLRQNPSLRVSFIPKSGAPGNDLTLDDAQTALQMEAAGALADLAAYAKEQRFIVVPNGPAGHGLDPARLSSDTAAVLARATAIVAEGQAYAEIRGWKKPTYIAFRVHGRVAEAIHGVSRARGACGFVRLTPGVDHFEGFEAAVLREMTDATNGATIRAASQTTSEYVTAMLSQNFALVVNGLFQGDQSEACRQLRAEARRLARTFAEVVIGNAAKPPARLLVRNYYEQSEYTVFACGGGGGFNGVTLKALRLLGLPVAAGVPSTDDGGSTGELQLWFRHARGFVFGVGDMAAILQDSLDNKGKQAVLAYRFDHEPVDLAAGVLERIVTEMSQPTYEDSPIGTAIDFLSFTCDQLNLARIIDRSFRSDPGSQRLPVKGASIRNLALIAAYELCGCLGEMETATGEARLSALYVLEKALGIRTRLMVLPVTYDECMLYLEYETPVPSNLAQAFRVPSTHLQSDGRRLFGQRYIDKLPHDGRRRTAGVVAGIEAMERRPKVNPEYLARLRKAKLFIMGAGSLIGSQLAQLTIDGVAETLILRRDMRRILVLNHVKMDETRGMSLREHVKLIETIATESVTQEMLDRISPSTKRLRIADLFTDVVIPRTVAREIEAEMAEHGFTWDPVMDDQPKFIHLGAIDGDRAPSRRILRNRYVEFIIQYPEVRERLGITLREIEVLSYMEQPHSLYAGRTEAGRYRGALFATDEDIRYLVEQGIQLRNIHEIDSIGENWKLLKSEGSPCFEFFPGLVPEALMGIIRIALERGSDSIEVAGQ
ncbi:MAG TPA: 2-phospho-L-lactate transferase CofD family protein [Thermoanaerobaculia bacterium]|nr:2-phospho-L-lactate transferase CofD family protein [Thermoanaerobaculia bacterium]